MSRFELGVRAIIKNSEGKFLFVRNDHGIHKGRLVPPGGRVEFKERAEDAIKREVKEETGLDFEIDKLLNYKEDLTKSEDTHYLALFFLGQVKGTLKLQDSEVLEAHYLSIKEIDESEDISFRDKEIIRSLS